MKKTDYALGVIDQGSLFSISMCFHLLRSFEDLTLRVFVL